MILISPKSNFNIYYILLFLYIIGIFSLSSIPQNDIPQIQFWFPIDKLVHFVEYGIFGFLLTKALLGSRKISQKWRSINIALFVIFATMILGAIDETYQHFTKRMPSIYDWFADVAGGTISMILTMMISSKSKTRKKR